MACVWLGICYAIVSPNNVQVYQLIDIRHVNLISAFYPCYLLYMQTDTLAIKSMHHF